MLLAALPATPVQTAHACHRYGFEIVVPASWGDELVAQAVIEDLRGRDREPLIQCTCPLVAARLLANGEHLMTSMVETAAPPIAAARYARHLLAPRSVHITYIGACPGAKHDSIDERLLPDEFLRLLDERDIALSEMPTVFDSVLPPDRRRYLSLPGGCPSQEALWQASDGRMLREVTQPTFSTDLAQTLLWREYVMIDVAPSLGCACAGSYSRVGTRYGRVAVMALEPPRAVQPVVAFQPEFTALHSEQEPPEVAALYRHNGSEPVEHLDAGEGDVGDETPEAGIHRPSSIGVAPSSVRVRTATAFLPRAYLAKRRHLAAIAREPEQRDLFSVAAPPSESVSEAVAAPPEMEPEIAPVDPAVPQPAIDEGAVPRVAADERAMPQSAADDEAVPQSAADEGVVPPPVLEAQPPNERWPWEQQHPRVGVSHSVAEPAPAFGPGDFAGTEGPPRERHAAVEVGAARAEPNEDTDASRPIALHVEPKSQGPEERASEPTREADDGVRQPAASAGPTEATAEIQADTARASAALAYGLARAELDSDVTARTQQPESIRAQEEEYGERQPWERAATAGEPPPTFAPASGPLRVEVLIEADAPERDVITPDVVLDVPSAMEAYTGDELLGRAWRPWNDVLIALWLVLVASAVVATLLWRR